MHIVAHRYLVAALLLTRFSAKASTITSAPKPSTTESLDVPKTCEFRTINYITDSLPQLCLKSSWSVANGTSVKASNATVIGDRHAAEDITSSSSETASLGQDVVSSTINGEAEPSTSITASSPVETAEATATDLETGELNEASFLSFEEWKKQTLDKAGQGSANIGNRKSGEGKKKDSENIQNNLDSLGDEGELDLDFGAFRSGGKGEDAAQTTETNEAEARQESQEPERRKKDQYRSKDAGITCKERFSYASFDAGATVLKTHPGAKNAKSVLIENKDSYMLSECSAENKFIIIELSEDIWIDTLVLANYEFFSSMIRTFRVSVSDRYPVKMEKWKDIGTYEARNSREIQAFLIENPQIWARYIRIEFLSHYGNEYYCPLSLVRVHGTRMLESWKETEANSDDDVDEIGGGEEQFVPDAVAEVVQEEERLNAELKAQSITPEAEPTAVDVTQSGEGAPEEEMSTPWERPSFHAFLLPESSPLDEICLPAEAPSQTSAAAEVSSAEITKSTPEPTQVSAPGLAAANPYANLTGPTATSQISQADKTPSTESSSIKETLGTVASASNATNSVSDTPAPSISTTATASKSQNITNSVKNKTTSTSSAASPLPTIQESFFKSVSRRLQLLETNSTLSLKYIEEQSKILREAFTKVEKKQLQKTTTFLDTLNSTVLNELRGFRQQYDEIWQSTVISLESQRDESRREILAISTRLNILADEVVFQKRMSIVQSILLLLCLGLVIFSRVSGGGNIDFPTFHSRGHSRSRHLPPYHSQLESPLDGSLPASPDFQRPVSGRWLETGHRRQHSDDTAVSRSRSRDESPPTPISTYSRSDEHALTPPSGADDLNTASTGDLHSEPLGPNGQLHPNPSKASSSSYHSTSENAAASPVRTPGFTRQQESPPASSAEADDPLDSSLPSSPQHAETNTSHNQKQHITPHPDLGPVTEPSRLPSPPLEPAEQAEAETQAPHASSPHASQTSPSHNLSPRFSIVRKPLPALPPDSG